MKFAIQLTMTIIGVLLVIGPLTSKPTYGDDSAGGTAIMLVAGVVMTAAGVIWFASPLIARL
ncbi:MAG TPA: hypothetical protein VHZ78_08515 [Rhizomicrobium sp.]|nr:hypothetical protein [Rhizomicrobium sp.]